MKMIYREGSNITANGAVGTVLVFLLSACAGMNHEPQSPEESPMSESAPAQPSSEMADAESTEEAAESEVSAEPASSEDLQQALQVVIQDDALLSELKLGEPGRFPLKISGSSLSSGLELKANTEAVTVVDAPSDPKTDPVLVFTNIDLDAKSGTFKYRYDVEGVRGTSYVRKNADGIWELKSSRVSGY